ncbi:hypothetical protein niasHT_040026 [Heterodera trifolii]|uniref:Uncharacterized protein n=1 Tax=Heterodera trifolii TaxID=157864 RepID=A0ABD2J2F7_9BILA
MSSLNNNASFLLEESLPEKNSPFPVLAVVLGSIGLIILFAILLLMCALIVMIRRRASTVRLQQQAVDHSQGWALVICELKKHHARHAAANGAAPRSASESPHFIPADQFWNVMG